MVKQVTKMIAVLSVITVTASGAMALNATDSSPNAMLTAAGSASAPQGWVQFCRDNPGECAASGGVEREALSHGKRRQLQAINAQVNRSVRPVSDLKQYGRLESWNLPLNGQGDCEDYVLMKRKLLIESGWSPSALSVTVVRNRQGVAHAVLTVRTDQGDVVLDNMRSRVTAWNKTGYQFISQQSSASPHHWVALESRAPAARAATRDRARDLAAAVNPAQGTARFSAAAVIARIKMNRQASAVSSSGAGFAASGSFGTGLIQTSASQ